MGHERGTDESGKLNGENVSEILTGGLSCVGDLVLRDVLEEDL